MNAESEIADDQIPASSPEPAPLVDYRGNGKVARLPKNIRGQINQGLLVGLSCPEIIERLGETGKDLRPDHLSEWKKRGHQDWLAEQAFLEQTRRCNWARCTFSRRCGTWRRGRWTRCQEHCALGETERN